MRMGNDLSGDKRGTMPKIQKLVNQQWPGSQDAHESISSVTDVNGATSTRALGCVPK